jgi:hypothetical protein
MSALRPVVWVIFEVAGALLICVAASFCLTITTLLYKAAKGYIEEAGNLEEKRNAFVLIASCLFGLLPWLGRRRLEPFERFVDQIVRGPLDKCPDEEAPGSESIEPGGSSVA